MLRAGRFLRGLFVLVLLGGFGRVQAPDCLLDVTLLLAACYFAGLLFASPSYRAWMDLGLHADNSSVRGRPYRGRAPVRATPPPTVVYRSTVRIVG